MRVKSAFMKKVGIILALGCLLVGCAKFKQQRMDGVVAECHGETITQADIAALTAGLTSEDSVRVTEQYIRQWVTNILVWEEAKSLNSKEIERKVADYHRSLCLYEWEQRMVNQRMPQQLEDSMVNVFYEANKSHFILPDPIFKGLALIVPNGAPNINQLREHLKDPFNEESIEWIEKYAYQNANGYELFLEDWKTSNQILQRVPFDKNSFYKQLKQKQQIEHQDSLYTYLLQVTEVHHGGDFAPLDYVRGDIEKMLLSERQVDFLYSLREKMYDEALEQGRLKIY